GPAFLTVRVYVRGWPTATESGLAVLFIERFALVTSTFAVDVLLFATGSKSWPATSAVFVTSPERCVSTTIETAAVVSAAIGPRSHEICVVPVQAPWLGDAETRVTSGGSRSWTVAPRDAVGPALCTVSVYVTRSPTVTRSGAALFVMERSALVTVV